MTPEKYCQSLVAKRGSTLYYSLIFLSEEQRQALMAIYAFAKTIFGIPLECQEIYVAEKKLAWWHKEIDHVYLEKPAHPISQALINPINHHQIPQHIFQGMIEGAQQWLTQPHFETLDDLLLHCHQTFSLREIANIYVLDKNNKKNFSFARDLGVALRIIDIVQQLRQFIAKDFLPVPKNLLIHYAASYDQLKQYQTNPGIAESLNFLTVLAKKHYRIALDNLPQELLKNFTSQIILTEIKFKLLDQIRRSDYQVLKQTISLPRLRKLWCAGKTYRNIHL